MIDGLDLDGAHLLGESQGAWHATLIALHARHRPRTLTMIGPNGFIVRPRARALAKFMSLSTRSTDKGWRRMSEWLTPGVSLSDEDTALARAAMKFRPGLGWARLLTDEQLAALAMPVLSVFGGESVLSQPTAAARRLAAHVRVELSVLIPGGGHGVYAQIPAQVRPVVLEFLRRHDS